MHIGRKKKFPNLGSQSLTPLRDRASRMPRSARPALGQLDCEGFERASGPLSMD